jgi:hypothetical protein
VNLRKVKRITLSLSERLDGRLNKPVQRARRNQGPTRTKAARAAGSQVFGEATVADGRNRTELDIEGPAVGGIIPAGLVDWLPVNVLLDNVKVELSQLSMPPP